MIGHVKLHLVLVLWTWGNIDPCCELSVILLHVSDVKLKESGAELVEVSDNGKGVEEDNFEGLSKYFYLLSSN